MTPTFLIIDNTFNDPRLVHSDSLCMHVRMYRRRITSLEEATGLFSKLNIPAELCGVAFFGDVPYEVQEYLQSRVRWTKA